MATNSTVHSDLAIPPGSYLAEVIEDLGMTKDELAKRMDRPATKLSAIFNGRKAITPDTAIQLEKVLGIPAHIWTGLEAEYRLTLERQAERQEEERLKAESSSVKDFCYNELAKMGFVKKTQKPVERVRELQSFLGVTSLTNIQSLRRYKVAFRKAKKVKKAPSPEALVSWLRIGEKLAQEKVCAPFDLGRLKSFLPQLRKLTKLDAKDFQPRLEERLAEAGVVLILCPHLPKTYVHGATFWLGQDKAVLMITIRGSWADIFWFSLFHELGHIVRHGKSRTFLEFNNHAHEDEKAEREADQFAQDWLIPPDVYHEFLRREKGTFYTQQIRKFANQIGVHSGIVVGRLQHDGYLERQWQNNLRVRLQWKEQ